jgi:FHS family L-fucose permease-like MFS transporter
MATKSNANYLSSLMIIGVLFFIFGFVTWVNSILITFFKKAFTLSNFQSYLVTFAFFISYTVMAIPSSWLLKRTGFKLGMSWGLVAMAVGTLLFVPAAQSASYPLFLLGLFVIGAGLTVLQTASNPYVSILGPHESAAQRISFMGIANKTAGIISQYIFGGLLLAGAGAAATEGGDELAKVIQPYLVLTGVLVGLALLIRFSSLPDINEESVDATPAQPDDALDSPAFVRAPASVKAVERSSVWQYPSLVLGVLALFLYVGVEVIAGDTIINYGLSQGFSEAEAKHFTTYTLYGMLAGYVAGIVAIPKYITQQRALQVSAVVGILFSVLALVTTGFTSVLCIALLGLANALMWPAIFPLAIAGLGRFTKIGSALLIMGIAGGALLPLLYGSLADNTSTRTAYVIALPCYLYILYYAMAGHNKKAW